jgi:cell division inhibitor SulA
MCNVMKIIETLNETTLDIEIQLQALESGEYLALMGWSQDDVEEAHYLLTQELAETQQ